MSEHFEMIGLASATAGWMNKRKASLAIESVCPVDNGELARSVMIE